MVLQEIKPGIYLLSSIDWSRRLFDALIPLPDGTTYNAYLIKGNEKIALIDTTDPRTEQILLEDLQTLGVERIDYVIANHAEQDHSGTIPKILDLYPMARVVANEKCKTLLMDLHHIADEKFMVINEGDVLQLGGRTLEFIMMPWIHWPETMVTYLREDKILFTCDLFGSHYATSDLYLKDKCHVYSGAKRYYAEIMMPFRKTIQGNLKKISRMDIEIIAPSHGPLYDDPKFIIDAYKDWTSDTVVNEVIIAYVSMHGSTEAMVHYLAKGLMKRGIGVKLFDLTVTDIGEMAMALVDAATIVIATPTVLVGPHPLVMYATVLVNALRPKTRFAAIIGSYGWGTRAVDMIKSGLGNLQVELLVDVYIKGHPREEDLKALDTLAEQIYERHKKISLVK